MKKIINLTLVSIFIYCVYLSFNAAHQLDIERVQTDEQRTIVEAKKLAKALAEPDPIPSQPVLQKKTQRNRKSRAAFQYEHPCPSTGGKSGACPGYVVDHIQPLACGGVDQPVNMQWQTVEEGKAKDKWERKDCEKQIHAFDFTNSE